MAAPRCVRSLFRPVKRAQIAAPRPCTQPFSRALASRPEEPDDDNAAIKEITDGKMNLDERLEHMGLDPEKFKQLYKSQQEADKRYKKWKPTTREESERKWAEMQTTPDHMTMLHMYKRAGVEPIKLAKKRGITAPGPEKPELDADSKKALEALRAPLNVRASYLRPLRRAAEHGVPVCDLQLRTYSIRNLLLFADLAVRAAYYMGLAARGPVPLPRITERWTVPRANFIFKKSQENFERITMRRLIQIQDGHPDVVKAWLAFLLKHQYHGVGMKANIWEYESLDSALNVGKEFKEGEYRGRREGPMLEKVGQILKGRGFKEAMKGYESPVELRP
ncbi:30S ribosomal protein-like protein S10 [Massariosphaeria phaeospora]|uniref:Small ribosomal subunit protein uS10m n=1 Tax=Massariosphaeria phaeospora TaxID=100035 RepID=A0A7C8I2X7_9PLEO|nr:30S ribosomal protein-like protein S10 [Massariosphaeria phaeospora]